MTRIERMQAIADSGAEEIEQLQLEHGVLKRKLVFIDPFLKWEKMAQGQCFGEEALSGEQPREMTVKCLANCHFMTINKDDYQRIIQEF